MRAYEIIQKWKTKRELKQKKHLRCVKDCSKCNICINSFNPIKWFYCCLNYWWRNWGTKWLVTCLKLWCAETGIHTLAVWNQNLRCDLKCSWAMLVTALDFRHNDGRSNCHWPWVSLSSFDSNVLTILCLDPSWGLCLQWRALRGRECLQVTEQPVWVPQTQYSSHEHSSPSPQPPWWPLHCPCGKKVVTRTNTHQHETG